MAKKNALFDDKQWLSEDIDDSFDLDELEEKLQSQLEKEFTDLEFLADEKNKIGNPDNLGNVIKEVVWEQFMNQIAVTAGEDFIEENNGLKLDLRNEAHIQTTENFANGNIATHNTKIDYKERYDNWQSNFQKDANTEYKTKNFRYNEEQQVWEKHDTRSGSWKKVLKNGARDDFDKGRPTGKNTNNTNMDHTISAAEIIRDPAANAHMTREEQIAFANSEKNLNLMDSAANQSKSDSTMSEWLDSERDGKKAAERFNVDEEALRNKDKEAREEYERQKKEAEKKSIEEGKQSQKEEAFRIGKKALRTVLMQLLADLIKEIIAKLVKWFKSTKKGLDTLIDSLKEAISSFISKMKTHMINAGNTVFSTVMTAIIGPIFGTIKKVWMLLKQGWKSLKDAVNYIKRPENKGKPIGRLLLETGKIIIAGLTGAGALLLGEVIEKGLMSIPIFNIEIPLIGSLANILGIFFGAVVSGVIGAIAINLIEKRIEKSQKVDIVEAQVKKSNEVLNLQHQVRIISEAKLEHTKENVANEIKERHVTATNMMSQSVKNIAANCEEDESIQNVFDDIDNLLNELEGDLL
ncbi:cation diffusion facilitator family transporter [Clostridium saudiense]|nr:cation diffusion facilitator family transporter [Clostridium saudiense]MDU2291726.1 cation diffusion facilitator family transporter [Clostridium celatum]